MFTVEQLERLIMHPDPNVGIKPTYYDIVEGIFPIPNDKVPTWSPQPQR